MPIKPRTKDFEILEHTADIGILAYGNDLKQTFANSAKGMLSLITDLKRVRAAATREVNLTADGIENLLVEWLNELIFLFDSDNFLGKKFEITELDNTHLKAIVSGEQTDLTRHKIKLGIKAATYHMLEIKQTGNGFTARVIFDI